VNLNVDFVVL